MARLVVCSACNNHVLSGESACPHCGSSLRSAGAVGRTAGAMLMGLSLAGCPASDDTSETLGNGETSSSSGIATSGTADPTTGPTTDPNSTSPNSTDPAYGNPATDTFGTTDMTASDTSTGEPDTTGEGTGSSSSGGSSSGSSSTSG